MVAKQKQIKKILELLSQATSLMKSEGLNSFAKDTEKLISRINGMGKIIPAHESELYSILRMMLESNTYYDSRANQHLEKAYALIEKALGEYA